MIAKETKKIKQWLSQERPLKKVWGVARQSAGFVSLKKAMILKIIHYFHLVNAQEQWNIFIWTAYKIG